jgi:hypothetical protein
MRNCALGFGSSSRPGTASFKTCALIPAARSARVLQIRWPSSNRGRRESRAPTAPAVPCARVVKEAHGFNYRYSQDIPAFPAQWLYGLYVLSPGKRPFLPPLSAEKSANVAPGSRRQDHTTSPYAASVSSGEKLHLTSRRPSPPAPTCRDDHDTPLRRRGMGRL